MLTVLLICHLLIAVALLGAITHQTLSLWWSPAPAAAGADYIAQRRGEEGLYEIAADAVMQLRQSAGDVKEAQAGAKK